MPEITPWWKSATGYQIYPRSFCDSNGDGIGDIPGIIAKLPHLAELGIGFIWLSPVFASPMVDNGYDISDYRDIAPEFGTLGDMDALIAAAGDHGIRIVMDLVVNHTSDQHHWFQAACNHPDGPERDFYIWRDASADGGPPSDQRACFGGSAWHWVPEVGQYYLGYFSAAQPDLNWQNPTLRAEVYDMMNWWLDRGIGGFRMDVISLIGKDVDAGIYEEGPDLHPFLQEMHREALAGRDVVTVGESWSVSTETAPLYCGRDRAELDMVFQFNHVLQSHDPQFGKFRPKPFDPVAFKAVIADWQMALADDGWNSLFLSNHDLPRQVSVYGDDTTYRVRSARMLAIAMHLLRGTPFVYQGEEIGMPNSHFGTLEDFRDTETLGQYHDMVGQGLTAEEFMAGANAQGRDNARVPMQWTAGPGHGFTDGTPWIGFNTRAAEVSVAADRVDPDGVMATYRALGRLRKDDATIVEGDVQFAAADHPSAFVYQRALDGVRIVVCANLTGDTTDVHIPDAMTGQGEALIWNMTARATLGEVLTLAPYEAFAVRFQSAR